MSGLPDGWVETTIEEIAEIHNVSRIPLSTKQRNKKKGVYPYYGASGAIDYIDEYIFDGEYVLISEDGENLNTRKTPIAFKANGKFWVNNHAHIVKGIHSYLNDYIVYYFKNTNLSPYITGAAQPKLSKSNLLSIPFVFPEKQQEQKSIANILSSFDEKIELLREQNETLETLAQTTFKEWLSKQNREDWTYKQLSDVLEITSSKRIFYNEYVEDGIPFYRSKEIIELSTKPTISTELFITKERFLDIQNKFSVPVKGDILLTSVGTLGIPFQVRTEDKFYFKDGNLTWFKSFSDNVTSDFVYCWLKLKATQNQLDMISIGSTQKALTIKGLKTLQIPILKSEQKRKQLYKLLEINLTKINHNHAQIQILTKTRDTLLPKLMSGQVRVN